MLMPLLFLLMPADIYAAFYARRFTQLRHRRADAAAVAAAMLAADAALRHLRYFITLDADIDVYYAMLRHCRHALLLPLLR